MNFRHLIPFLLILPAVGTGQPLSIDDAIRMGRDNNRLLKVSAEKSDAASARATEARSALLPSVKFDAGYRRLSDVDPFQVSLPILPHPVVISPTVLNTYSAHVGVQQPLFTGFRLLNNAAAASRLAEAGRNDELNDRDDLTVNIISAYWSVYQAGQVRRYVDENAGRLASYLADTRNLMRAGLATKNDVLRIEVQENTARLTQIDAANDLEVAGMHLNNLIGRPLDAAVVLASLPDSGTTDVPDTASLVTSALRDRPDLHALAARVEASKASASAAAGGFWPQIFLTGNYYYQRPNQRYQPTRDDALGSWDVGVQLQFDVWNWGATSAQTDQASAALRQSELLYDQAKDNTALDVRRNTLALLRAQEKVGVARTGIDQADENVRSTEQKFRSGLSTSTELLDASVALLQARMNFTGALVEREIARAKLIRSTGGWH